MSGTPLFILPLLRIRALLLLEVLLGRSIITLYTLFPSTVYPVYILCILLIAILRINHDRN